jgi:hypothetical protein
LTGWYLHAGGRFYDECFISDSADVPAPAMNDDEIVEALGGASWSPSTGDT